MLSADFDYDARVVIRDRAQMRTTVERAPAGFGTDPDRFRYDVLFLKPPLTASAMKSVRVRDEVNAAAAGRGVLYFSGSRAAPRRATSARSSPCPSTRT